MHADELRTAVAKIVDILKKSDIRSVVDQYRSAKGDQRTAATVRLGHAGANILEAIDSFSPEEQQVVKCLHLESLGSAKYWQSITNPGDDLKAHQGEIVRLASRIMFASGHLPAMVNLISSVDSHPEPVFPVNPIVVPLDVGEGGLYIRLTDAGERASDPDRIARAIDGIDMLYSACASIAKKPAIDLRLDALVNRPNRDRDFRFTGERDSIAAVFAVIDSIPAALADIDPDQDIDLDSVVRSLPIFQDLNTLASLGTFSGKDLKDISETMHQGALLTLESGVILIDEDIAGQSVEGESASGEATTTTNSPLVTAAQDRSADNAAATNLDSPLTGASAAESDEHYNRYLREREAMLRPQTPAGGANGNPASQWNGVDHSPDGMAAEDKARRDAVDDLLKSLGQSRSS